MRVAKQSRITTETKVNLSLNLDGTGESHIKTGIGFLDHMLTQIARHGFLDLDIEAEGDLVVDSHHTAEDVGLVLGKCLHEALGDKKGIRRYGSCLLPMEESLAAVAVDFSGRPLLCFDCRFTTEKLGDLDTEMIEEFFRAVCSQSGMNLHIKILHGKNNHHMAEAIFKGFGKAIDEAKTVDPRIKGALSSKGMLEYMKVGGCV